MLDSPIVFSIFYIRHVGISLCPVCIQGPLNAKLVREVILKMKR